MKILVAILSCWYVFRKITQEQAGLQTAFEGMSAYSFRSLIGIILAVFFLSIFNWIFEILKWKILISEIKSISFKTASNQSLIAHAVAVFTPNRIGDFGVKILFFEAENRKRILGLNFLNNIAQMAVTILFGIIGFLMLNRSTFKIETSFNVDLILWFAFSCGVFYFMLKFFLKNYLKSIKANLQLASKKQFQVFVFSLIRYVLFSHQYFMLGWVLGWNLSYFTAMPIIFVLYFVASFLPSIFILDSALKAGIGIYLFSTVGVSSLVIVAISSIMWLLNFAFPAIVGNVMMLQSKLSPLSVETQIRAR